MTTPRVPRQDVVRALMPVDVRPVCDSPEGRRVVDAAFADPTSRAANLLRERVCPACPVREACLRCSVGEHGLWAGTSTKQRTRAGMPSVRAGSGGTTFTNMQGIRTQRHRGANSEEAA